MLDIHLKYPLQKSLSQLTELNNIAGEGIFAFSQKTLTACSVVPIAFVDDGQ